MNRDDIHMHYEEKSEISLDSSCPKFTMINDALKIMYINTFSS